MVVMASREAGPDMRLRCRVALRSQRASVVGERPLGRKNETRATRAIIVMGVSGCGKSTLAAALGEQLGCSFFEGDSYHSEANVAKMRSGHPLTDADRWPWLDRLGEAIGKAVREEGVAVAACSALKRAYRDRLRAAIGAPTIFVLLEVGRAELVRRLNGRPDHYMPASLIDSQLAILEPPMADEQAIVIEPATPPGREVEQVSQWLAANAPDAERLVKAG